MTRTLIVTALVIAAAALAYGCGSRLRSVDLEAPAASAPVAERARAYDALVIRAQTQCGTASCLRLGDGRYVYRFRDLDAVLDPQSPASRALRSARRLETTGRGIAAVSLATWTTGVVLMVRGAIDEESRFDRTFWIGTGLWGASHAGYVGLFALDGAIDRRKERALDTYNDSLRESLGL